MKWWKANYTCLRPSGNSNWSKLVNISASRDLILNANATGAFDPPTTSILYSFDTFHTRELNASLNHDIIPINPNHRITVIYDNFGLLNGFYATTVIGVDGKESGETRLN